MAVMKDVKDWIGVSFLIHIVWKTVGGTFLASVPDPILWRINAQCTTGTEQSIAFGQWWVNTHPSPTWMDLAYALYHCGEDRALEKVAQYLPKGTHMENVQAGMLILCSLVLA